MLFKKILVAVLLVASGPLARAYNPLTHFGEGFRDTADRQNLIVLGVGGALTLVALRFDVPEKTIDDWLKAGLEHVQWNGRVLTSVGAIERFLQMIEDADKRRVA